MSFLKSFFGGGDNPADTLKNFAPSGFSGGGFNSSFSGGNLAIIPTAERSGLVQGLGKTFGDLSAEIGGLKSKVTPGFSDLRRARLSEIDTSRANAIGNLRENLARRRVLGSSFGQDALARTENEFALSRDKVQAETFLQELEATNQLIQQDFAARRGQFQTGLDELNLQADIATKLSANATNAMQKNAATLAELQAKEQAGAGKFVGDIAGALLGDTGKVLGNKLAGFFK